MKDSATNSRADIREDNTPTAPPVHPPPVHSPPLALSNDSTEVPQREPQESSAMDRWFAPIACSLCIVIFVCSVQIAFLLDAPDESIADASIISKSRTRELDTSTPPPAIADNESNESKPTPPPSIESQPSDLQANESQLNELVSPEASEDAKEPDAQSQQETLISASIDQPSIVDVKVERPAILDEPSLPTIANLDVDPAPREEAHDDAPEIDLTADEDPAVAKFNPIRVKGIQPDAAPEPAKCEDGNCNEKTLGTQIQWAASPAAAYQLAHEQGKLVYLIHVSGNFEIPGFT